MPAGIADVAAEVERRKQRWSAFLEDAPDSGGAPGREPFLFLVDSPDGLEPDPSPPKWPSLRAQRVQWILRTYERMCRRAMLIADDRIPCLDMMTGTEIFAEAMGCEVERPEDNMPFARSCVRDAGDADRLMVPELSGSTLAIQFEMADEVRRRTGPDATLRLVDVQSPMDIASLIWDKNDLFLAMVETPDAVIELAARVRRLQTAFFDEWFRRYGSDFVAHYPTYYMPRGLTVSEDEIGTCSTDMFDRFFYPELEMLAQRYGALGIHCCAHAEHQWAGLARVPNLKLVNLVQPNDTLRRAWKYFARSTAQMHCWMGDGDPLQWHRAWPRGSRMVITVSCADLDTARRTADQLNALRARLRA